MYHPHIVSFRLCSNNRKIIFFFHCLLYVFFVRSGTENENLHSVISIKNENLKIKQSTIEFGKIGWKKVLLNVVLCTDMNEGVFDCFGNLLFSDMEKGI